MRDPRRARHRCRCAVVDGAAQHRGPAEPSRGRAADEEPPRSAGRARRVHLGDDRGAARDAREARRPGRRDFGRETVPVLGCGRRVRAVAAADGDALLRPLAGAGRVRRARLPLAAQVHVDLRPGPRAFRRAGRAPGRPRSVGRGTARHRPHRRDPTAPSPWPRCPSKAERRSFRSGSSTQPAVESCALARNSIGNMLMVVVLAADHGGEASSSRWARFPLHPGR